ncbi:Hexosyltransferase [Meloidogyne graminicola]|uniref:Hexosyltransferase n=1 Tax=Meloidogyne graminicola TaxID=189291 RepID=A0A8T0A2E8_9BILA|nr:Hexosyltransferase [Meloidogyne graminicola]
MSFLLFSYLTQQFLPFCKEQNLSYFYKFYSLKEYSQPDKTPLNWINIKLVWEPLLKPKLYYKNKNNYNNSFSSLFIVVISKLEHFKQRKFLRKEFKEQGISSFIFVLSVANASKQNIKNINEEFAKEGDLLVLNNYRLLTYKTRAWLQWVTKQFSLICGPPRFILKIDDDLMINWNALFRLLQRAGPSPERLLFCRVIPNGQISRNPASKWFLSSSEYKRNKPGGLGLYCQGMAIILSGDLIISALSNLRHVQFLWMDDWYLTHALLFNTNVTFVDIGPQVSSVDEEIKFNVNNIVKAYNVYYTPIFAHFRPAEHFPESRKLIEWKKMLGKYKPFSLSSFYKHVFEKKN